VPQYEIHVLCTECGAVHPMRIRIHLENGPVDKQSLADTFQEGPMPPQVSAIEGHKTLCLKTGKIFIQDDNNRIFLVPSFI
jgi:hypothetical protein